MRHLISALFLLASTAHAVEANTSNANVDSGGKGTCKVAVSNVGESMPAGSYQGQCVNGKPNGIGEVIFANGDHFSGMFKNGRIDGKGTWVSGSSGNTYAGYWQNGKREGTGVYSWAHSSQQYVGEWADDKRNGKGTLTWRNGDRFEGEFRDNKQYNGTYFTAGGATHTCYMGSCR
jgi:hypothetical protein